MLRMFSTPPEIIEPIFGLSLGGFFMTHISRETKLKTSLEYKSDSGLTRSCSDHYIFSRRKFRMLVVVL